MSSSTTAAVEGSESESTMVEYLSEHPRMMGALFTMFLLLTQVGNVAAGESASFSGP